MIDANPQFARFAPTSGTRRALITGVTGQDGSYLAEFLMNAGYEVHGLIRRSSTFSTERVEHLYQDPHDVSPESKGQQLHLHYGDVTESSRLARLLKQIEPDEVYNLGAQSHVRVSFDQPVYTAEGGTKNKGAIRGENKVRDVDMPDHFLDWLQCLRSRKTPNASIDAGYQHAVACLMAMESFRTGKRTVSNPS